MGKIGDASAVARSVIEGAIGTLEALGFDPGHVPHFLAFQSIIRIGAPLTEEEQLGQLMALRAEIELHINAIVNPDPGESTH